MILSLIVAAAENNVIGKDNQMPWHISEDFKHFKEVTMGKPCIMGRKTYESILAQLGKALPGRSSIVISRTLSPVEKGQNKEGGQVFFVPSLEEAISKAKEISEDEIMVIGGAQIYKLALPLANRIYLTRVHQSPEGDAFFPALGKEWIETSRKDHEGFSLVILEKN